MAQTICESQGAILSKFDTVYSLLKMIYGRRNPTPSTTARNEERKDKQNDARSHSDI
jgi:hypothetical protein